MNPFKKPKPHPFNPYILRVLWHYYNGTSHVSKMLLKDYCENFRAG